MPRHETRVNQELAQMMLDYANTGKKYFSKWEFEQLLADKYKIDCTRYGMGLPQSLKSNIKGIYMSLCRLGYVPKTSFKRTFPNTEKLREGLQYLVNCKLVPGLWLKYYLRSQTPIHFLELEDVDPQEFLRFKKLYNELRDEIR